MLPTDQTHLRRYFATLGVAIAVGTLSLAGLFLNLQQDLLVPQSALAKLTPTARDALMRRQGYLSLGTTLLPWFVLVGFLGGIGLSAYGLVGWARRQKVIDEREDIGLHKERVELRQLTETEKADKLERDAQESVTEAKESVTDESPTPTGTPPGSSTHVREVRTELSFAQQNLVEKLSEIYSPDKVLAPARLVMLSDELIEEITVSAAVEGILFELRYGPPELVRTSSPTLERLRQVALAAITAKSRAVLIVVVSDYTTPMQIASWTAHVRQIAEAHYSVLGFYVGKYSDFIALSARDFEAKVGLDYTSTSGYRPYVHKSDEDPYKRPR